MQVKKDGKFRSFGKAIFLFHSFKNLGIYFLIEHKV
jgi:hypothetical protein